MPDTSRQRLCGSPLARGISLVGQLVREERQRERPPGEVGVCLEPSEEPGHEGQSGDLGAKRAEAVGERFATLRCVQVARKSLNGGSVELELAVWVAAGGQNEHGAPPRGEELRLRHLHPGPGDERE
jgi:hypothetical protein